MFLESEPAESVLRDKLQGSAHSSVLLLSDVTTQSLRPSWKKFRDGCDLSEVIAYIEQLMTENTSEKPNSWDVTQNFVSKMLQIERMVTMWRTTLRCEDGSLFPLDNIILMVSCQRIPSNYCVECIKEAVPTVHALLTARQLLFVDPKNPLDLDQLYQE